MRNRKMLRVRTFENCVNLKVISRSGNSKQFYVPLEKILGRENFIDRDISNYLDSWNVTERGDDFKDLKFTFLHENGTYNKYDVRVKSDDLEKKILASRKNEAATWVLCASGEKKPLKIKLTYGATEELASIAKDKNLRRKLGKIFEYLSSFSGDGVIMIFKGTDEKSFYFQCPSGLSGGIVYQRAGGKRSFSIHT